MATSLVPRPFPPPVFDHILYKGGNEARWQPWIGKVIGTEQNRVPVVWSHGGELLELRLGNSKAPSKREANRMDRPCSSCIPRT